jgi:hypothetical protein
MARRRLLTWLLTLAALALAALPAAVAFGLGWLSLGPLGVARGGSLPPDTTPPERWVLFALVYFAWMFGAMVLLVWCHDRLGRHWTAWERAPRLRERRRRRVAAGLSFLAGQEKTAADVAGRPRPAQTANGRRSSGDTSAGRPPRRADAHGPGAKGDA